ncbi:hypothetical protein DFH09DRAFT_1069584 [Mycena vulgaris]|nr:hypothetical protein DFH09DRAFT_1069584 [Mycena vulgaris]
MFMKHGWRVAARITGVEDTLVLERPEVVEARAIRARGAERRGSWWIGPMRRVCLQAPGALSSSPPPLWNCSTGGKHLSIDGDGTEIASGGVAATCDGWWLSENYGNHGKGVLMEDVWTR